MDFGSVLSLAAQNQQKQRHSDKKQRSSNDGPRKEKRDRDGRPKSEFLQKAFEEKEQERRRKEDEERQRQNAEEKKKVFRIPKKPRQPEEQSTEKQLSEEEKREKAKKLAASLGGMFSKKSSDNKSSSKVVSDRSEHRKSNGERTSSSSDVKRSSNKPSVSDNIKKTEKKPSYLEKLEKLSDQEKLAIIKKISESLGRKGDKISDEEKLDKIRKISETIGKGPPTKVEGDDKSKVNGLKKESPLSGKVDKEKYASSVESLQKMKKELKEAEERVIGSEITLLGKTDEGIKREVKHFDRSDAEKMRQALQEKAARIKAMMSRPVERKPRERKRRKGEGGGIKSEEIINDTQSSSEDEGKQTHFDSKKISSHSIDSGRNREHDRFDRLVREEKSVVKKKPPPPPSMNFNDLLKVAEIKSQEPIKIEVVKKKMPEEPRLMSKKEIQEKNRYEQYLQNKKLVEEFEEEQRKDKEKTSAMKSKSTSNLSSKSSSNMESSQKTLKKNPYSDKVVTKNSPVEKPITKNPYGEKVSFGRKLEQKSSSPSPGTSSNGKQVKKSSSASSLPSKPPTKQFKMSDRGDRLDSNPYKKVKSEYSTSERTSKGEIARKSNGAKRSDYDHEGENVLVCGPSKGDKSSSKPTSSNPFDRIYGEIKKNNPSKPVKRKHADELTDSEDEFDEDMDDFVVDYLSSGEEEEMDEYDNDYDDYSKHIRNIFGYDKRKFRNESYHDIANMESSFRECMKEEARSARLGMQEDIEDMKKEEEEMRRKMAAKKKKR